MNRMERRFFWWMDERYSIFLKKEAGEKPPWTKDKIMQEYKFTNVYREDDRVTRTLAELKRFWGEFTMEPEDLLFNIIAFRMFNWPPTYMRLSEEFGNPMTKWTWKKASSTLHRWKLDGNKVFTGAYIITNNGMTDSKIDMVCRAVEKAFKQRGSLYQRISDNGSMEGAVEVLSSLPMVGGFIGYEIACDLRYTSVLDGAHDVMTWANPGPGANRGLNRIYGRELTKKSPKGSLVAEMCRLLGLAISEYDWKNIDPSTLEMREVEHSLCEFDKYMRVLMGEGRPRSKYNAGGSK